MRTEVAGPRCRSCHAPIRWARNVATGVAMPLDAAPDPRGTVVLTVDGGRGDGWARVLTAGEPIPARPLYVSHFATCVFADQHRGTGGRR